MSVKGKRKKTKSDRTAYKPKTPKKSLKQYLMIGFVFFATIAFIFSSLPSGVFNSNTNTARSTENSNSNSNDSSTSTASTEPQFTEEGSLSFIREDGSEIRNIKIEVADDESQRARGMMFRKSIPTDTGMLFIMATSKPQSFYMRNTYVSLDILFIDENFTIVNIGKKAVPLTETNIKSEGNAKYVLEVAAGYTDAYDIKAGDKIQFELK